MVSSFLAEIASLGAKLGPVLIQLPPSLAFDRPVVDAFFRYLRLRASMPVVCEPRHPSWFEADAEAVMTEHLVDRVAADPSVVPQAAIPGGCGQCIYFRWHGSPRMYYSDYSDEALQQLAGRLRAAAETADNVWCVFDNTALGAATANALLLNRLLDGPP
jgi:uncharacterized protein YecE (DUF72 family)